MQPYKYFTTLVVLYVVIGISSLPLGYKLVQLGPFLISGGAFFVPFRFLIGDILAEVYGYKIARKQIFNLVISGFVFSIFAYTIIHLPSPPGWEHQAAYDYVLGKVLYITAVAPLGIIVGSNINMYIVSKLRILLKNRFFFVRSISASISGELIQYTIVTTLIFVGTLPASKIAHLIIYNYCVQLVFVFTLAIPASFVARKIRNAEGIDLSKEVVKFNPFK